MSLADNLELGRGAKWRPRRSARRRAVAPRLARSGTSAAPGPARPCAACRAATPRSWCWPRARRTAPDAVITCHPTRGLDPGASATVADRLLDAAAAGAAVVWMGAELEEVLAVAHRVIVLSRGVVTGEFARPFDRSAIGLAMGGHA